MCSSKLFDLEAILLATCLHSAKHSIVLSKFPAKYEIRSYLRLCKLALVVVF